MRDKLDAKRYRWLRDSSLNVVVAGPLCVMADKWGHLRMADNGGAFMEAVQTIDGSALDRAIDEAIREGLPK